MEILQTTLFQLCVLIFVASVLGWMTVSLVGKKLSLFWFPVMILKWARRSIVWFSRETSHRLYRIRNSLFLTRTTGLYRFLAVTLGLLIGLIALVCAIPADIVGSSRRR